MSTFDNNNLSASQNYSGLIDSSESGDADAHAKPADSSVASTITVEATALTPTESIAQESNLSFVPANAGTTLATNGSAVETETVEESVNIPETPTNSDDAQPTAPTSDATQSGNLVVSPGTGTNDEVATSQVVEQELALFLGQAFEAPSLITEESVVEPDPIEQPDATVTSLVNGDEVQAIANEFEAAAAVEPLGNTDAIVEPPAREQEVVTTTQAVELENRQAVTEVLVDTQDVVESANIDEPTASVQSADEVTLDETFEVEPLVTSASAAQFNFSTSNATFSVYPNNNSTSLLNSLLGNISGLSNFSVNVIGSAEAFGLFENDPFGLGSGVVLSTGRVVNIPGQNTGSGDLSTDLPGNDSITLEISFDADSTENRLLFEYVFGSEEFLGSAGGIYNDSFQLLLNGVNLAKLTNGLPVTINNLASSPSGPYHPDYINNPPGAGTQTKLNGFTKLLQFEGTVIPNARNTLTFNIRDVGDSIYDSAVFIKGGSVRTLVPDLVVSNITAPPEGFSGQDIEIAWTVTNQGNLDATGTWTDYVYLSDDPLLGGDQLYGTFSFTGTIADGTSIERKQLITLPQGVSGTRWVIVKTDADNQIFEAANESNNTLVDNNSFNLRLSPFPNLQVTSVTAPPSAFSSQQAAIEWTVTNKGTASTSAPFWKDSVWLSLDNTFDNSDTFLGSVANTSYLNVGESYTNSLTVNLPRGIDDNYYFLVKTDANNDVNEFNSEGDNFGVSDRTDINLTPPPDFQVTGVNAPAQGFSGQPLTLNWTVTNAGPGRNLETSWYDDIFMSTDQVLDASDRLVGRRYASGTYNPGSSYNATHTVDLPTGASGDFFFFVRTDAGNGVYEHVFEGNNTGYDSGATTINLTPPPDLEVELVDAPASASASRPLSINYRVTNFGATATPNSFWTDTFYLSTDSQLNLNTDLKLGSQYRFGALDAGAFYDTSATFTLPDTISGSYYAFVVTDSANDVFELDNNNNIAFDAGSIAITSRPADLVVDATIPNAAEAGKAIWVDWTVTNQGLGDTAVTNWSDRIVASKDAVLGNGDDIQLAGFERNGLLNPSSSYSRSELVSIPFEFVGQYNLFFVTDADNRVYEATNEANNSIVRSINISRQTPDLQVTQISAPVTAQSGQLFTVNWAVQNQGGGRTNTDYWYDDVYLSIDSVVSSDDIRLGRVYRSGALEPSAQYNVSETFNLPIDIQGQYYTLVRTDSTNGVVEAPFDNNNDLATISPVSIALAPVPDLVVGAVDAPTTAFSGQSLNVTWTVNNTGGAATGNRSWFDAIYLSRDQFFDRSSDIYLGFKYRTGDLAAGASYTETASFAVPQGLSGPFYAFAVTDSGEHIHERNGELNNAGYDAISTQVEMPLPADLVVDTITVPANGIPGQNGTISYTVTNQGANPARGSWFDGIYLSKDNQWDAGDILFGRVQHFGDVPSGGSYSETLTAPLPGAIPGNYHVIVRSDIRNQIRESEETNNTQASQARIALAPELLQLDIPDADTLAQGQSVFYRVDVPAGETLLIEFDSASATAANEVYVSYGKVPTRADFDFAANEPFSADQRVLIPSTEAGTYFIQVRGNNVPGQPAAYNIVAELAEFSVFDDSYGRGGNAGNLTLEINGAKFDRSVTVRLTDGAGVNRQAVKVYHTDATKAFATFDLTGLAPGNYDVVVGNADGGSITVNDGLEVVSGGGGNNRPFLDAPASVRRNSSFNFTTTWYNDGINDALAPLLLVANDTVPFGFSSGDFSAGREFTFLGTTDEGPAGILRPGQSESIAFFSASEDQAGTYEVIADRLFDDLAQPFDFESVRSNLIPAEMSEAEFQPIFQQLIAQIGPTQGDYLQMLSRNATLLPGEIGDNRLETELLGLELTKAIAAVGTSISGSVFARSFEVDLSGIEVRAENTVTGEMFTTVTLNDGSFVFEDLTPGSYSFAVPSALIQGASPVTVDLAAGEALTGLTMNLAAGARIFGDVTKATGGTSVANAGVLLFSGEELVDMTVTDAEGRYVFDTLAPGSYTLMINSQDLARTWVSNIVVTDDDVRANASLAEDASVTGTVTLADGQPVQNLAVIASLRGNQPFSFFTDVEDSGNLSLGSLAAGVYDITVFQQGYEPFRIEGVNVAAGGVVDLGAIELAVDGGAAPLAVSNADDGLVDLGAIELAVDGGAAPLAISNVAAGGVVDLGAIKLAVDGDAAPWLSSNTVASPLNTSPPLLMEELYVFKGYLKTQVFDIIRNNNLGREVEAIANTYFNSTRPNQRVTISSTGFKDNAVTNFALEYTLSALASNISRKVNNLPQLKEAIDNFRCGQSKPSTVTFRVDHLKQRLNLPGTLFYVEGDNNDQDDAPEVWLAKKRWKYSGTDNIPGFLAGGVGLGGSPPADVPTIYDYRHILDNSTVTVVISPSGEASLVANFNVEIGDTFDFNPGGIGPLEDNEWSWDAFTTAGGVKGLGLIEQNGLAYDVPFKTSFTKSLQQKFSLNIPTAGNCRKDNDKDDDQNKTDDTKKINVPASFDPNDILGPEGFGEQRWVTATNPLAYTIRFENDPDLATAPAQTVRITQQLDSDLDFRTFRVGDFGFGDTFVDVPDNRAFYQTRVDVTETLGIYVDVVAGIDIAKGEAFWEFTSIDPATGEIPADPLRGLLPRNLTPPEGDGFVKYTVRPKSTVATGAVIDAQARIVFDINEPIDTPPIFNTIDATRPSSTVEALPATVANTNFLVKWGGSDDAGGSALGGYTIYVSENGGEFTPWLEDTTLTEATFVGQPNSTYAFYSVARDNAGNAEAPPTTPDAVTATGMPSPGIILTQSGNSTDASEQGQTTDTYTITLKTVPTGAVNVQVAASDGQTQISSDGINFSNTLNLSLTNRTPVTITVRPVEDSNFETSPHTGTITHAIISSADPAYSNTLTPIPNVTVNITDNDIAIVSKLRANFSEVFGPDKVTRLDSQVNYDWGGGTPDPLIGNDYFVAQWSGLIQAPVTGQYTLFTNSDDGVRLYFEDQLVVDDLRERGWEEKSATVQMEAGKYYRIRLQYLENNSGAGARLSWLPPGGSKQIIPEANLFSLNNSASVGSGTGLRGIYYDNGNFTGTTIARTDSRVAFDWGGGTPDPLLGSDDFSVRWEGFIEPQYTEKYSFHTIADDGVRLWVNNQLVIDDWNYHGYQIKNSGSIDLVAGQKYDIKLEYFEGGGGAGVSLMWSSYSQGFEVIPTSQLSWSNNNVTLAVAPATVNEGGTTNLVYTFTRSGDLTKPLTVKFNVGGTAILGSDYTQTGANNFSNSNGTVTFAANSATATVTITPTTDSVVEVNETVELTLTEPINYTIGTTAAVSGTITDSGNGTIVSKLKANFSEVFGPDKVTRLDSQVNYDWGGGTPDPLIGNDHFVGQWSGLIQATVTGQYTLFTNSDDGVRLYFEDQLVVDELREGNIGERSANVQMEAGKFYRVRLQYLESSGGANARLSWQPPGGTKQVIPEANLFSFNNSAAPAGTGTGLRATYYDNGNFTGTTVNRTDSRVAFDWGGGTPDPLLGSDDFSVRWEGKVEAQYTEKYSFHTIADDGVRLWVNNQLVIDDWNYHGYQIKNSGSIDLVAGQKYDIKLEYFEGGGGAGVSMMWSSYNQGFEVVPTSQLFPN